MSAYPTYGKALIECATPPCDWRGYETEMASKPDPKHAIATIAICPKCKSEGYYFVEDDRG